MSSPAPLSMFIVGIIVFVLYLTGYVYMIYKIQAAEGRI